MDENLPDLDPASAASALALTLTVHADDLAATDLSRVSVGLAAYRRSVRLLEESLRARGWQADGDDLEELPDLDDGEIADGELEVEFAAGFLVEPLDDDESDDEDDGEFDDDTPVDGPKFTYQCRFDFIVVDEQALEERARARALEVSPGTDPAEGLEQLGGALGLLLYLDNPTFRDYESSGLLMAYGSEFIAPVEATLDEFELDEQDDAYP